MTFYGVMGGAGDDPDVMRTVEIDALECERCEGTGDLYGRTFGPIALCPDCSGSGVTPPEVGRS